MSVSVLVCECVRQCMSVCVQSCCVGSAPVWVGDLDDQA